MELLLLLGGNIGDVRGTFDRASAMISERLGPLRARSRDHLTEPWGFSDDRLFLNRALVVDTDLAPPSALERCMTIEKDLGRVRSPHGYAARTIDIDLLLWKGGIVAMPDLRVPHPRVHERLFALAPAADVAPSWHHPELDRTVLSLLNDALRSN